MEYRLNLRSRYRNKTNSLKLTRNNLFNDLDYKYIKDNPDKHYFYIVDSNLDDVHKKNISILSELPNLTILLNFFDSDDIQYLKEKELKFALNFPVTSYQTALELIHLGASEIRVHGELGFNETWQNKIKKDFGISIAATPQLASIYKENEDSLNRIKSFFIPPRFLRNYSTIDYIDFSEDNQVKEDTLYKIYAIDQRWDGDLSELISGLNTEIDERYLIKDRNLNFSAMRKNCKQKCLRSTNGKSCHSCDYLQQLSSLLSNTLPNY